MKSCNSDCPYTTEALDNTGCLFKFLRNVSCHENVPEASELYQVLKVVHLYKCLQCVLG